MENMFYTLTLSDHDIIRINVLGPGQAGPNFVKVHTILSSKDAAISKWGQFTYEIHKSCVFKSREEAKKESFLRKLKGRDE